MKKIGIFLSSKYFDSTFRELSDDLDSHQIVYRERRMITTPETLYSFHTIDRMQDVERISGLTFDFVQIHWSVKAEYFPYIMLRCRGVT